MKHVVHCLDCKKKNKRAEVFGLEFGSEVGSILSLFSSTKREKSDSFSDTFPASDNCLVRDSEADESLLRNDGHLIHFLYYPCTRCKLEAVSHLSCLFISSHVFDW